MRIIVSMASAAILTLTLTTYEAHAKEYKASFQSPASLGKSCGKAGGKSFNGQNSYGCHFKNGNLKECSKRTKGCIIVTKGQTAPPSPFADGKVMQPATGLLDPTPGLPSGGPSSTGTPLGGGGGRAAPAQIR